MRPIYHLMLRPAELWRVRGATGATLPCISHHQHHTVTLSHCQEISDVELVVLLPEISPDFDGNFTIKHLMFPYLSHNPFPNLEYNS